ncbi:MAG: hypothetical protein JW384_03816 [Nitrosomonadaceae bacterium]|nr:hypothetical protein [Nitrosomonadaceae bacterium]
MNTTPELVTPLLSKVAPSHTRQLVDFAHAFKLSDVPEDVVDRAKWLFLDGLGCGLHGSTQEWTKILAGVVNKLEPQGGQASIWGYGRSSSATNAALVNGTMVQGYELDDGNPAGSFHSCAVVLPAVIAAAEYVGPEKVSGERLLTAIIAGFEIGPRVSICMGGEQMIKKGWHAPAVVSAFPAAISAGIVLGLSPTQLFHAIGIAGTQASGLMAAQYGSMVKRMQCAKNSQSGLYAVLLAAEGFTGIENVFEEQFGGFCTTFTDSQETFDLDALTDGLGSRWETMRIGMKIYPCAGGIHTAISAVEKLMHETGLKASHVEDVSIYVTEARRRHHGWHPYVPKGMTAAQFHYGFCLAMQLIEAIVFVEEMGEKNSDRLDVIDLANSVRVLGNAHRVKRGN